MTQTREKKVMKMGMRIFAEEDWMVSIVSMFPVETERAIELDILVSRSLEISTLLLTALQKSYRLSPR